MPKIVKNRPKYYTFVEDWGIFYKYENGLWYRLSRKGNHPNKWLRKDSKIADEYIEAIIENKSLIRLSTKELFLKFL